MGKICVVRYRSFSPCPATEWKSAALSASMHAPPCCPPVGSDGRCSHAMVEFAHRSESPMESSASSQRGLFQSGTRRIWEEFKKEEELPVNDELLWDNGTPFPEPCIDRLAPHIGKYEALAWLCRGLGFFAALGVAAAVNDKASKIPYVSVHC
ncbi:hypothetical protein SORBI_3009G086900 [Sorghum bicolor]|uniref:Uncharacterized protein n=1 Tax=Sorghum bicolor TaxID=4558 RepID=A0A1Z5R1M8_SORBI|nr:hypothetical protein SORBI_3009G086900 [Sorghum bicolor]OQU77682.1 hypothetical protein SORBI_3009G086900 [Sorghum bicolor]